jgi:hypothetical protein
MLKGVIKTAIEGAWIGFVALDTLRLLADTDRGCIAGRAAL